MSEFPSSEYFSPRLCRIDPVLHSAFAAVAAAVLLVLLLLLLLLLLVLMRLMKVVTRLSV